MCVSQVNGDLSTTVEGFWLQVCHLRLLSHPLCAHVHVCERCVCKQAFMNHRFVRSMLVGERDIEALGCAHISCHRRRRRSRRRPEARCPTRYLRDVRCSLLEPVNSYALELEFAPNPFFEDRVLRREYHYSAESGRRPYHLVGHTIAWKVSAWIHPSGEVGKLIAVAEENVLWSITPVCWQAGCNLVQEGASTFFQWFYPQAFPYERPPVTLPQH